jgi:hypothetical protein
MPYNYYTYKSEKFTCTKCTWSGIGSETFLSELSEIHTFRDIKCPNCGDALHTFDLTKVEHPTGNPMPDEKVCYNCTHMMWMVGLGLGLECRLTRNNIENRRHTCDQFDFK